VKTFLIRKGKHKDYTRQ